MPLRGGGLAGSVSSMALGVLTGWGRAARALKPSVVERVYGANGIVPARRPHRSSLTGINRMNQVRMTSQGGGLSVIPGSPGVARKGLSLVGASISVAAGMTAETGTGQLAG